MSGGNRFLVGNSITNERNDRSAIAVETQMIESTFSEEYEGENTEEIAEPDNGNTLVVTDVFIGTSGNKGTFKLDIGDKKVARMYGSQWTRFNVSEMTIPGEFEEPLELDISGVDSGQKTFVLVNFIEIKGRW